MSSWPTLKVLGWLDSAMLQHLPEAPKTKEKERWLICDYSAYRFSRTTIFVANRALLLLDLIYLDGRFKVEQIDQGYKSICLFSFLDRHPESTFYALPVLKGFEYNPNPVELILFLRPKAERP